MYIDKNCTISIYYIILSIPRYGVRTRVQFSTIPGTRVRYTGIVACYTRVYSSIPVPVAYAIENNDRNWTPRARIGNAISNIYLVN